MWRSSWKSNVRETRLIEISLARPLLPLALALVCSLSGMACAASDTSPQAELARWQQAAGQIGDAARGQLFFKNPHGGQWSCASCHGQWPTRDGQHASTGKRIAPLAPAVNSERLTDSAKVDKWFRRNCKDVLSRECNAIEKADVLAYLVSLK